MPRKLNLRTEKQALPFDDISAGQFVTVLHGPKTIPIPAAHADQMLPGYEPQFAEDKSLNGDILLVEGFNIPWIYATVLKKPEPQPQEPKEHGPFLIDRPPAPFKPALKLSAHDYTFGTADEEAVKTFIRVFDGPDSAHLIKLTRTKTAKGFRAMIDKAKSPDA